MKRFAGALLACAATAWSVQAVPRIRAVRSEGRDDTLRIDFEFLGGRPEAYRIGNVRNDRGKDFMRVQIEGASMSLDDQPKVPRWMAVETQPEGAEFRIPMYGTAPWRARWAGDTLRLELRDQLRNPIWTYPWFVGTVGTGLVAGGVVLWVYANGQDPRPPAARPRIPDPQFEFPK